MNYLRITARQDARQGLSLIEVIVASVLIAALAMTSVATLTTHRTRMSEMQSKSVTIEATDRLLQKLTSRRQGLPTAEEGMFHDSDKTVYRWRATPILSRPLCGVPVQVVRLDVIAAAPGHSNARGFSIEYICQLDSQLTGGSQ